MKNSPVKPWYKRWKPWAYVFAFMFVVGIILPDMSEETADQPAKESLTQTKSDAELAAEKANEERAAERAAKIAEVQPGQPVQPVQTETKPEPKPADPPKIKTIEDVVADVMGDDAYVDMYTEDGTIWLTVKLLDNWSAGWMLKGAYMDTLDISEQVVKHNLLNGAKELDIAFVTAFTDAYGNSSDGTAVEVTFSADTLAKINFDSVLHENVPAIADYYFEHPIFSAD